MKGFWIMQKSADTAYTGEVASRYEQDRHTEPLWETEQEYIRQLLAGWPVGGTLLDVPIGTGRFLPLYFERGISVWGLDISEDMLAAARERYKEGCKVELIIGSAQKLNLPSKSVDHAICWRFAHLVNSEILSTILGELARVVKREFVVQFYSLQPGRRRDVGVGFQIKQAVLLFFSRVASKLPWAKPWANIRIYTHFEGDIEDRLRLLGVKIKRVDTIPDRTYNVCVYVIACDS